MEIKTIIIIAIIAFGIYWLSQNQPEIYDQGKTTLGYWLGQLWDKITNTPNTPTNDSGDEIGNQVVYGKPLVESACTSDLNCIEWKPDVPNILCNMTTGQCYKEVN